MYISKLSRYIDLFFCLVFLPLIITLVPVERWIIEYPVFAVTLIVFLYCVFFSVKKIRLPEKIMKKKYSQVFFFCIFFTLATYFISKFPYPDDLNSGSPQRHHPVKLREQTVWFMFLVVSGYSLSISLIMELFRQTMIKRELTNKRKMAELALYQAQINPHFFFNTMNTLYGLVLSKSDLAEKAFILFNNLLKYTYTLADKEKIPLQQEIQYIKDYIELQNFRLNRHTEVIFSVDIDNMEVMIPTMLFVPFVENAFKYGVSSTKDSLIQIMFKMEKGVLSFQAHNSVFQQRGKEERIAIGIENTKNRLSLLYAGKYALDINEEEQLYKVYLSINLN